MLCLRYSRKNKPVDMNRRYVSIWFYELVTDWFAIREPALRVAPFVTTTKEHGRMVITAINGAARRQGITIGMVLADARVVFPELAVKDDLPELSQKLLMKLAAWCIRFTPCVSIDAPHGLLFDATGCAHLWGGDEAYLTDIIHRLNKRGYHVRTGMADTIGAAWAIARYGKGAPIMAPGEHHHELQAFPAAALRIDTDMSERLYKLGLHQIHQLTGMPRVALRRRFGQTFLQKLDQAFGHEEEVIEPVIPMAPYQDRLPCFEPVATAKGIEIALERLLGSLCTRLVQEGKGIRQAVFKCFRIDNNIQQISIHTGRPSTNLQHLFKLFEIQIPTIAPGLGIELFVLEAPKVENVNPLQLAVWKTAAGLLHPELSELLDRIAGKFGAAVVHRYLPDEHYWPERSFKPAASLDEQPATAWITNKPRPVLLLPQPEQVQVTAPVPDYPPMNFRYKGKLHTIIKADGPERIEQEWWLQQGQHRDYYCVEDENGCRYWLFRLGHYDAEKTFGWYIHGFFA
jgi:protein ImuB